MTSTIMEEFELMKESKYRMYVAAVDKALKNFEYTSEWADLISALGKLNKVLSTYLKYPVIPRRIKISKRLAQCMHPALPSGVHLKALETYDIIFCTMGTNRLAQELFIYSSGLFPLLGHAAMNIRPQLLKIYENHFVPLGERMRPALSGFLSGVLPGIENGSDHFERTNDLLEKVCEGVGQEFFYTCMWQCVANNSPVRLSAISYILAHYSKKYPMEDQLYLMGHDIDLMVCGLCASVQDSSVLVQRSALDLLMVCFPMNTKHLLYTDMVRLVTSALSTVLRRDMSLNRRLYSWLLETDNNKESLNISESEQNSIETDSQIAYDLLNDAIRSILLTACMKTPIDIKPYRLLTSLFDKPQIGPVILDNILYEVFRALYLSCLNQQKAKLGTVRCVSFNGDLTSLNTGNCHLIDKQFVMKSCSELVKNANLLFNTLHSYYIWSYIEKLFNDCVMHIDDFKCRDKFQVKSIGNDTPHIIELCFLTDFLLDIIPIESYGENTDILSNLFSNIIKILKENIIILNSSEISQTLKLCTKILTKIQPTPVVHVSTNVEKPPDININNSSSLESSSDSKNNKDEDIQEEQNKLEKSKSDSKINETLSKTELLSVNSRERSNSNQMLKNKDKFIPKSPEKKNKNKKSKSSSKLDDLQKESIVVETEIVPVVTVPVENNVEITIIDPVFNIENVSFLKCLQEYEAFYVSFIEKKVLPDVEINKYFQNFVCDKNERIRKLENLLKECLSPSNTTNDIRGTDAVLEFNNQLLRSVSKSSISYTDNVSSELERSSSLACNLLLEFSAFPNLIDVTKSTTQSLPMWLEALITTACYENISKDVQLNAMSATLEIFSLAKNCSHNIDNNTNVFITGILNREHVSYIEENTVVLEEMAKIIWNFLSETENQNHITMCVTLLYQIHNIFDDKLFAENIIGKYLSTENVTLDYIKRFFILWHLGRDLNIKLPPNKLAVRNFDRSMLKIVDNLQNYNNSNLRLLSEAFLTHSLLHNDIGRILNPILLKLLSPNTSRVAIRFVNLQDNESRNSDIAHQENGKDILQKEPKLVYAVSNIDGNIMYHVTTENTNRKPPIKNRWFAFNSRIGKKNQPLNNSVNVTTSVTENSNVVTRKSGRDFKINVSTKLQEKNGKNNVKLFVNPLGAKEIYPHGINGSYSKISPNNSPLHSSNESLTSDGTASHSSPSKSLPNNETDFDSGFNSAVFRSKTHSDIGSIINNNAPTKILESIEPISDGFKEHKISKSRSLDDKSIVSIDDKETNDHSLIHSWSYSISDSDNLHAALEISASAEEFFKTGDEQVISDILNTIINHICEQESDHERDPETTSSSSSTTLNQHSLIDMKPKIRHSVKNFVLYPIHSHICLYYDIFDSQQVFYALQTLKNCILSEPQLFIKCLATNVLKNLQNNEILNLLARHRKSLLGFHFGGELGPEYVNFYRSYMFLDIIISICLNYARTFYPCLNDDPHLTNEEMNMNFKIQLEGLEILEIIVKTLNVIVSDNTKGFSSYIADMLVKCKLQKILLHCLLTSVRSFDEDITFAEEVLMFNNFLLYDSNEKVGEHVEAFQMQLLRLIQHLIVLEHKVFPQSKSQNQQPLEATPATNDINYKSTVLTPHQQIFLSAVMSALRHKHMRFLHEKWLNMITASLPYFGENLKQISISVIHQICNNIEDVAATYKNDIGEDLCPDYAITQLESLTILCHYSLLDANQMINQRGNLNTSSNQLQTNQGQPTDIFNNLFNAFFSLPANQSGPQSNSRQSTDNYLNSRKTILSHMPRIISSVAKLWQTVCGPETDNYCSVYGNSKVIKQRLLEFLSPIAVHHGASFLAAVAVAWFERRNVFSNVKSVLPDPNQNQNNLVYLISAIRVIPLDNLVQTVTAVIKNPPATEGLNSDVCLDVSILELFYCYMKNASKTQLSEAWNSLLVLIKEGCALPPAAQYLLAAILHELMIKCCPMDDKKDQKDLQDVTTKLIESVSQVCGACLEQTTWLRRNLAVKEQDEENSTDVSLVSGLTADSIVGNNQSVQAQLVLSEILAPIMDICFGSSEKDKVNTILTSLMYNIVPYLKTHTIKNMPSFLACSKLLASLSGYQYTRKAWKKDVFDLLFDNTLFQMDQACLKYWKIIIDNLMTHDMTTFRDLLNRVSLPQSGSLSLFTSREQEYEQKAQLLKRLAYVIFCSEMDQYAKYMSDIQEQLTTSLRLPSPNVQAQVFMCFRVLLIRMSAIHVTSLWPIIISEMLQVFLQIEQELTNDTEEFRTNSSIHIKLLSSLDASWAMNSNNGLHALGHPHWLRLQLATAKLLDLALLLPAVSLPQFQMYRWAFVGEDIEQIQSINTISFVPHVVRIANLMDRKYTDNNVEVLPMKRNELLLMQNQINQLQELHPFFKTLKLCSGRHRTDCLRTPIQGSDNPPDKKYLEDKKFDSILEKIDRVVELDFLDKIPR